MAIVFPSEESDTEYPKSTLTAAPSILEPLGFQSVPFQAYTKTLPEFTPFVEFDSSAPTAKTVPSPDIATDAPKLSPGVWASMAEPRRINPCSVTTYTRTLPSELASVASAPTAMMVPLEELATDVLNSALSDVETRSLPTSSQQSEMQGPGTVVGVGVGMGTAFFGRR